MCKLYNTVSGYQYIQQYIQQHYNNNNNNNNNNNRTHYIKLHFKRIKSKIPIKFIKKKILLLFKKQKASARKKRKLEQSGIGKSTPHCKIESSLPSQIFSIHVDNSGVPKGTSALLISLVFALYCLLTSLGFVVYLYITRFSIINSTFCPKVKTRGNIRII